jgi:hypothetical protein
MYKKLSEKEKALRKLRRSGHPETFEELINLWKGMAEKGKKNARRLAESEDYESAAYNNWMAEGFQSCAKDLEDTLTLQRSIAE